jgi:antitoxin component YwqK of YwqJK toxin-antitoxin module
LHVELNEAWILADDDDAQKAAQVNYTEVAGETLRQYEESYPDGKPKAKWTAGVNAQGVYLLHGEQSFYYPDGQLQWQVTFENGLKVGRESYYRQDGSVEWHWQHDDGGSSELTVFDDSGKKKAVSQWKDNKLLDYQIF